MEVCSRFFFINGGQTFIGVLKIATIRQFNQFILKLELHRFRTNDKDLINIIAKECEENPYSGNILNRIDTTLEHDCIFKYSDIEKIDSFINQQINKMEQQNSDPNLIWNINLNNKFAVLLTLLQYKRLYNDLHSFYVNYSSYETTFRMLTQFPDLNKQNITKKEDIPKISDSIKKSNTPIQDTNKNENLPEQNIIPPNMLDNILAFTLDNHIRQSLIHFIFIYYQYINHDMCIITKDESNITNIKIPNILPNKSLYNSQYFRSLITSNINISLDSIGLYLPKLVNALINNVQNITDNPLYVMMSTYILYIYSFRYLYESHSETFINNFENILIDVDLQTKMLNLYINHYAKENNGKIRFQIYNLDLDYNNSKYDEDIKHISNKYKHLIQVSEEDFLKSVLIELENNINYNFPIDFNLNKKKIIDLKELYKFDNMKAKKINLNTELFGSEQKFDIVVNDKILMTSLLDYQIKDKEPITLAYKHLLNYANNQSSVLLIKDNEFPKNIKMLFDILNNILNRNNFPADMINTLDYYKVICNLIPSVKQMNHLTVLYIIFQIIIPYYFDVYKVTRFQDSFL